MTHDDVTLRHASYMYALGTMPMPMPTLNGVWQRLVPKVVHRKIKCCVYGISGQKEEEEEERKNSEQKAN